MFGIKENFHSNFKYEKTKDWVIFIRQYTLIHPTPDPTRPRSGLKDKPTWLKRRVKLSCALSKLLLTKPRLVFKKVDLFISFLLDLEPIR